MAIYYHRADSAEAILREGLRDAEGVMYANRYAALPVRPFQSVAFGECRWTIQTHQTPGRYEVHVLVSNEPIGKRPIFVKPAATSTTTEKFQP